MSNAGFTHSSPMVELEDVTVGYWTTNGSSIRKRFTPVLKGIQVTVRDGERVAVIGESGSGKTTLLKVMLGILPPVSGRVRVLGHEIYRLPHWQRWKVTSQIGYVPQEPARALNPRLRIRDIVMEPLERFKLTERERDERVKEAIRMVQLHESILDYYPTQLSGGMMQRALIARAIVHDPEILLLDEPTSALDVSIQAQIINLLDAIQRKLECSMITVTHDLPVAQYLADRAVLLHKGTIVEDAPFEELIRSPKSEFAKTLIRSYTLTASGLIRSVD